MDVNQSSAKRYFMAVAADHYLSIADIFQDMIDNNAGKQEGGERICRELQELYALKEYRNQGFGHV